MPVLSEFTPCGFLTLSSDESYAETIYDALVASLGKGNYSVAPGSRMDGWCYANAMAFADVRYTLERAGQQLSPSHVDEMLPDREDEYGVVPSPMDTLYDRRAVLASRRRLSRGARRESVIDALQTLLGDNFVFYRTTKLSELANWPTGLGDQPQNLQRADIPRKIVRLVDPISIGLGSPKSVRYMKVSLESQLLVGDRIVIEPEILGRTETVTITSAFPILDTPGAVSFFTATFNQAHEPQCLATTQPFPAWVGSKRFSLIVVKSAAAIDPEIRRKVNELMQRIARGVSTWAIVQQITATTCGPFTLGVSPLGATTIGSISFP